MQGCQLLCEPEPQLTAQQSTHGTALTKAKLTAATAAATTTTATRGALLSSVAVDLTASELAATEGDGLGCHLHSLKLEVTKALGTASLAVGGCTAGMGGVSRNSLADQTSAGGRHALPLAPALTGPSVSASGKQDLIQPCPWHAKLDSSPQMLDPGT